MEASLAICILAALLATGTCLQCEVCTGAGNNCTGTMKTCAAGEDSCAFILTDVTVAGVKRQSFLKGCLPSSECKVSTISMNFGQEMTMRTSFACCVGDACRTTTVTVPPADTTLNGRRCPACIAVLSAQCNAETIACTGAETKCIDAVGTVVIGDSPVPTVMKGCVSQSMCLYLNVTAAAFAGINLNLNRQKCTEASDQA
ncbi:phospholipase A2 inhibitor and Ly6/PLAUR domain-containing protein-like [Pangshura tecta]